MPRSLSAALLLAVFACGDAKPDRAAPPFEILPADPASAGRLVHKGTVVQAARWRDRLGLHTLLLTQTGEFPTPGYVPHAESDPLRDAELYAYDYVENGSTPRLLWRTFDYERECQFDLHAGFVPNALTLTDLDGDETAEVTFLYTLSCRSDVSPATRKLIMREGEAKYAIRGTTRLSQGYGGGEMHLDPSLDTAPAVLREYVIRRWNELVAHDP